MNTIEIIKVWPRIAYVPTQIGKYLVSIRGGALFFDQYDGENGGHPYMRLAVMDDFGNLVRVN